MLLCFGMWKHHFIVNSVRLKNVCYISTYVVISVPNCLHGLRVGTVSCHSYTSYSHYTALLWLSSNKAPSSGYKAQLCMHRFPVSSLPYFSKRPQWLQWSTVTGFSNLGCARVHYGQYPDSSLQGFSETLIRIACLFGVVSSVFIILKKYWWNLPFTLSQHPELRSLPKASCDFWEMFWRVPFFPHFKLFIK